MAADIEVDSGNWGCVVIIIVAVLCFTAYQVVDRLGPERPKTTEVAK